jgi:serine/threonine-protein kinase
MPEQLGRYEILEELSRGGFAVVHRARDTELDRQVALKELHSTFLNDTEWLKRFKREARTIAKLNHSHIVTIHDVLECQIFLYQISNSMIF